MKLILLLFSIFPLIVCGQQAVTPILPLPDHIEYREGSYVFPQELRVYAGKAKRTCRYMATELEKRFGIRVVQVGSQQRADCVLLNASRNSQSEAYALTIRPRNLEIQADSEKGIFYGVQSLLQLMAGSQEHPVQVAAQCITDAPRFGWRSFMLDEARFFKGEVEVLRLLDVMAELKMNVFHWHLTNDQGWRIESKKYPLLTEIGSKRRDSQADNFQSQTYIGEPHEGFYTQEQIKRILAYARERHIKVVPEIEMPGHASAAIASYPWLGSSDEKIEVPIRFGKLYAVYNVIDPKVQTFLKDVVDEMIQLFQCDIIHIGGDEVRFNQWEANPLIADYKQKRGFSSFMDIQIEFTNQMSRFIQERGCRMMGWNEILGKNLHTDDNISFADPSQKIASNVIVQFWKGELEEMRKAAENGYQLVNSFHEYTYLDYSYETTPLRKTYEFDPIPQGLPQEYEKNVMGIGAQMWGEFIPTVESMNKLLYPRVAALAEVGWSKRKNEYEDFLRRVSGMGDRWRSQGIEMTDLKACEGTADLKVALQEDSVSLLRNPCMGWGVYDDANDEVQNAEDYWTAQDKAARQYASFFYVRWRWSDMEPEEGQYAWLYDENYKKLIQGALDRGLKLCFRVYDNGQDNLRAGTPEYVRRAGAKGYKVEGLQGRLWTPYPDDPVYQKKMEKFVAAFAKEYDNPDIVDFVDGYCLGWWGECHHVVLQDKSKLEQVFDWYTTLYSTHFKRTLLLLPFGSEVGFEAEKRIAIDRKGYGMRRDGLGSMWYSDAEREIVSQLYGRTLFVGESCYWGPSDDDKKPFALDTRYKLNSWRETYEQTYRHAMEGHFNTLDLRELPEAKRWTELAPDLVQKFIIQGGYRIHPTAVTLPTRASVNGVKEITHEWINSGNGYLPNNLPGWNYKYKPAFALFNQQGELVKYWMDSAAEPSEWLQHKKQRYTFPVTFSDLPKGTYQWAVAIVDWTNGMQPGIKLAIRDKKELNGWVLLGTSLIVE